MTDRPDERLTAAGPLCRLLARPELAGVMTGTTALTVGWCDGPHG
ncbi:MAG TPA: hypothetical protein VIH08_10860 [Blastococcus sp.]